MLECKLQFQYFDGFNVFVFNSLFYRISVPRCLCQVYRLIFLKELILFIPIFGEDA